MTTPATGAGCVVIDNGAGAATTGKAAIAQQAAQTLQLDDAG